MEETLCWSCYNCYNGCSWSRNFTPVKGWKAEYNKTMDSYNVITCPKYIEESECDTCKKRPNILLNDKDHYFNYCPYCTYVNSLSFSNQKCKNFEK